MEKVKITQIRSTIKCPKRQKMTIKALGLRGINKHVALNLTPSIQGMVRQVGHLVVVENIV